MTKLLDENKHSRCHICHDYNVELLKDFASFYRVTSDCRPWTKGGKLGVCKSCGNVQKVIEQNYFEECSKIYDSYAVYHQSQGSEQKVFEQNMGHSQVRSEALLKDVFSQLQLLSTGHLLDVGCGNGNLLHTFSKLYPEWVLSGSEINESNRSAIEKIKNVEAFYSCEIKDIPDQFDLVTMIHCLEHIVDPIQLMLTLHKKINDKGLLLIEVPDYSQNPFDLVIADHCSHFSIEHLKQLLSIAGFDILLATGKIIPKELTILAKKKAQQNNNEDHRQPTITTQPVIDALICLKKNLHEAQVLSKKGELGLFGTSIASTWLSCELGSLISFYADEDITRVGKKFMGRNVYLPKDVPTDCHVFLALPFFIAEKVWERMQSFDCSFYLPPYC